MPKKRLDLVGRRVLHRNILGTIVQAGQDDVVFIIWDNTFDNYATVYPRRYIFEAFQLILKRDEADFNQQFKVKYRLLVEDDADFMDCDDDEDDCDDPDFGF